MSRLDGFFSEPGLVGLVGYPGYYLSDTGKFFIERDDEIYRRRTSVSGGMGYERCSVTTRVGGKRKTHNLANLVWRCFRGELPKRSCMGYLDGDIHNCRLDNLYETRRSNDPDPILDHRILELSLSGIRCSEIARLVGIPYDAVLRSRKRSLFGNSRSGG